MRGSVDALEALSDIGAVDEQTGESVPQLPYTFRSSM